jgi:hypothetical protein
MHRKHRGLNLEVVRITTVQETYCHFWVVKISWGIICCRSLHWQTSCAYLAWVLFTVVKWQSVYGVHKVWMPLPGRCVNVGNNSMELNPSWEAASCAATQEFPNILRNQKVHYDVYKNTRLVPILSQIKPVHTTPSYLRSILILFTNLHLGLPSDLIPSGFPTNILYAFLFSQFVLHALPISSSLTWSF